MENKDKKHKNKKNEELKKEECKCSCDEECSCNEECSCDEECNCNEKCSCDEKIEDNNLDKIKKLEDALLRSQAELVNYKRRKDEETSRIIKYAEEDILKGFLPILDNFERAINLSLIHI